MTAEMRCFPVREPANGVRACNHRTGTAGGPWVSRGRPLLWCVVLALALAPPLRADDDGEEPRVAPVEYRYGVPVVRLAAERQASAGLRIDTPVLERLAEELRAGGVVADLSPLLALRARYRAAVAEREVIDAEVAAAERQRERLRLLHRETTNVAARQLQEAEAAVAVERARRAAVTTRLEGLVAAVVHAWGDTLAAWALGEEGTDFESFVAREQVLVRVTLDAGETLPDAAGQAWVARDGARPGARAAQLVSAAPVAGAGGLGETWFFRTDGAGLRVGMRVDVWIPRGGAARAGVRIPESAVVWHGGHPWVYVQLSDERFARRRLADHRVLDEHDWFVAGGLATEDRIVVTGAQVLLSEEFRWNIPEEEEVD